MVLLSYKPGHNLWLQSTTEAPSFVQTLFLSVNVLIDTLTLLLFEALRF